MVTGISSGKNTDVVELDGMMVWTNSCSLLVTSVPANGTSRICAIFILHWPAAGPPWLYWPCRSYNIQLIMDSSGCTVTWCFIVKGSVSTGPCQKLFLKRCIILCEIEHVLIPELQGPELWFSHWNLSKPQLTLLTPPLPWVLLDHMAQMVELLLP